MRSWTPEQVAQAAGARLAAPVSASADAPGPLRVTIDSRAIAPGDLFVGLPGETHDGGRYAAQALAAGAWGVLVAPQHAQDARCARTAGGPASAGHVAGSATDGAGGPASAGHVAGSATPGGVLLAAEDPLAALQALARAWRRELGAKVIAITGSTGKTSTKDILAALLEPHRRTFVSRGNFNTEIGLPLELLAAPAGTEALVLEMGMRGPGQIAELAAIAEPDVGVIVNVGPAHLELLGSLEAIAAAKAELIADLHVGATAIVPAGEPLLDKHRRTDDDVATVTFGPGGDVTLAGQDGDGGVEIDAQGERVALRLDFQQAHLRGNLLAAVAAARAIGVRPDGRVTVTFSGRRGERMRLANGVTVIDDCYNANPMSMRAALDDLAATAGEGRRVAVLGDMLELGPQEARFHAEIGAHAATLGLDLLVAVGPRSRALAGAFDGETVLAPAAAAAAALVPGLVRAGDTVLVKASRGVGLEAVTEALAGAAGGDGAEGDAAGAGGDPAGAEP
ncbi:MAG TPA: UDP-N-acetylmuramoyl-tripeptide--D-alanyl-D-alanine ligase [Conexibacter sp.]|jgi:UDP-N-acetylmuramoyl-tripeptide--D-alanyl-D-alanine ligase|nr:UDP-N-acetylmuramoyl-tripeptide--D-alanyl-D-alanine ligase [Conexibacter sp.]